MAFFVMLFLVANASAQGTALRFDNSSQSNARYVNLGGSVTLKPNLITVELWAKSPAWHQVAGDNTMISNTQGGGYALYVDDGTGNLVFYAYANGAYRIASVAASAALVNNRWHHIAGTWDGTTSRIYVDGVLRGSTTPLGSSYNLNYGNNANVLFIGAESAGTGATPEASRYFNGEIDEVRIWNTVRSAAEIRSLLFKHPDNNAAGLLALYKCDDAAGTSLANSCTNTSGINGTLHNSTGWYSPSPVQFSGNALQFDGVDDVVTTQLSLSGRNAFTLEGWIYPVTAGNRIAFFGQNDALEFGFSGVNTITGYSGTGPGGANSVSWTFDNTTFPMNAWHHVAFTADGSAMHLYVDGIHRSSVSYATTNYGTSGDRFRIGAEVWDNTGNHFNGAIDEVRVWSVARSQAQIQASMNSELDPVTETGLMAYYTFNQGIINGDNTGLVNLIDQTGNNHGVLTNMNLSGASSNFVAQRAGLTVLPLQWKDVTARYVNGDVAIQWQTASEQLTRDFVVQHSDATGSWSNLGIVAAAPGADLTGSYQFTHHQPASGIHYYRIMQRDQDGQSSYSKTVSVTIGNNQKKVQVFPNPVTNGTLSLQLLTAATIQLFSMEGKMLIHRQLSAGSHRIDVSTLPAGIYRLRSGEEVINILIR